MVAVPSPQPNELEQKRRRQTLERAKASHLSKQLQMRLQYAKLKVEHGWQRQNLNEVENLYFHHAIRQAHRPPHPPGPGPPLLEPPSGRWTPTALDPPDSPLQSPTEHIPPHTDRLVATPLESPPASSTLDLSDPGILARLAQLHAHSQTPSTSLPTPLPPTSAFPPLSRPSISNPTGPPTQPPTIAPNSGPALTSTPYNPPVGTSPIPTATIPAAAPSPAKAPPIAPTALTYDSFWSTHASSTGPTRALYRTHAGFTASATPAGNVAMLTPGGHAAVMTAEGVYVGGAGSRSG